MPPKTQANIRLRPDHKAQFEKAAERLGLTLTGYLTIAALEKIARDVKPPRKVAKS